MDEQRVGCRVGLRMVSGMNKGWIRDGYREG
jgi:hypothetical protein